MAEMIPSQQDSLDPPLIKFQIDIESINETAYEQEKIRDLGAKSYDHYIDCPLYDIRWPGIREKARESNCRKDSSPELGKLDRRMEDYWDFYRPATRFGPGPDGAPADPDKWNDHQQIESFESHGACQVQAYHRFNPKFVKLTVTDESSRFSKAVTDLQNKPEELVRLMKLLSGEKTGKIDEKTGETGEKDSFWSLIVKVLNDIGDSLYGEHGHPRLRESPYGWLRQVYPEDRYRICPVFVLSLDDEEITHWGQLTFASDIREGGYMDFMSEMKHSRYNVIPRLLGYQLSQRLNRPLTGSTHCITLAGLNLRLWAIDAGGYASSRLCRLDLPEDAAEVVGILALMFAPDADARQLRSWEWHPSLPTLELVSRAEPSGPILTVPVSPCEPTGQSEFTLISITERLFGTCTTVWTRKIGRSCGKDDMFDEYQVLKATWLEFETVWQEHDILTALHSSASPGSEHLDPLGPLVSSIDQTAIKCLHRSNGLVKQHVDIPVRTRLAMPNDKRRTINTELSILSTIGPLGHRLPSRRTTMTIKQLVQIMRGVFQCLWFCASKGIHYRDLNLGNIVFLPVPGSKDDMTGFLIDFGNARHLDKPRSLHGQPASHDKLPLIQKDDHVSSTLLYRSTNLFHDESDYYSSIQADIKRQEAEHLESGIDKNACHQNPDPSPYGRECHHQQLASCLPDVKKACHRFVDDLESTLYCFLWQIKTAFSRRSFFDDDYFFDKFEERKGRIWESSLKQITMHLPCDDIYQKLLVDLANKIKACRKQIDDQIDQGEDIPAYMTALENACFAECDSAIAAVLEVQSTTDQQGETSKDSKPLVAQEE